MRALCLISGCPLPVRSQDDERLVSLLEVWASMATLDVVVRGTSTEAQRARLLDHLGAASAEGLPECDVRARGGRLRWITHPSIPPELALMDPRPARQRLRRLLHERERPHAVFAGDPSFAWLARPAVPPVPRFVDVPHVHGPSPWSGPPSSIGDALARVRGRSMFELLATDRRARFELHEAGIAHLATVRSTRDREALGVPGALVLEDAAVARSYWARVQTVIAEAGTYAPKAWL